MTCKRSFDFLSALVLIVVLSPAMLLISVFLWCDRGPVLFWHERIGRNGKAFLCPKFRSMSTDADARLEELLALCEASRQQWEERRKLLNDPRVTRFGKFLRESSLDELPQLWSVIKGDMSLVGPRPVTAAELSHYGEYVGEYLKVRPGLSGLWQVSGRSDLDFARRIELDVHYVRHQTLRGDLLILARTVLVVLMRRGAA